MLGAIVGGFIGGALGASTSRGRRCHTRCYTETRTIVKREKIDYKRLAEELVAAFKEDIVAPWREQLAKKQQELEEKRSICAICGKPVRVERVEHVTGAWDGEDGYYDIVASCWCKDSRYKTRIKERQWKSAYQDAFLAQNSMYHYASAPELHMWDLNSSHDGAFAFVWKEILKHFQTLGQDENSPLVREIKELEEKIANPYQYINVLPAQNLALTIEDTNIETIVGKQSGEPSI